MNSPQMEKDRQEGPVKKHANQSYVFYPYISSTGKPIDKYFSTYCYCFDASINTQPYLNSSMWYFNTLQCLILPQYLHQVRLEHPSQKPPSETLLSVYVLLKICLMTNHYHSIQARNLYVIVGCRILRNHKYPSAYKGVDQSWLEENVTRKTHDMEWSKVKSGEVDNQVNLAERSNMYGIPHGDGSQHWSPWKAAPLRYEPVSGKAPTAHWTSPRHQPPCTLQ